jgi:hypothetical protein
MADFDYNNINWDEVSEVGGTPYWKLSDLKPGDSIVGLYLETLDGVGQFQSTVAVLERLDNHAGEKWYVTLNSVLMTKFNQIKPGGEFVVRIEYLGKVKGEKGGREYNNFKVQPIPVANTVKTVKPEGKVSWPLI